MKTITVTLTEKQDEQMEALKADWGMFMSQQRAIDPNILDRDCLFTDAQILQMALEHFWKACQEHPLVRTSGE